MKEKEDLKSLLKKMVPEARALATSKKSLKVSLEGSLSSMKKHDRELSVLKDELLETLDQYFKWVKAQISFIYLGLDLSQMDLFKMVCDGQLVDDEKVSLLGEVV